MSKAEKKEKPKLHIVSWSGGKDSTATIILAHELGIKIDLILISLLWFDKKRGGCWFCPNQPIAELAELKQTEPDKWHELEELAKEKNTVATGFKYGAPFEKINSKVDDYIKNPPAIQLTLFDILEEAQ